MNFAVFASHFGSTLQAIIDASESGALAAKIRLIISNNSGSEALKRAERASIAWAHFSSRTHPEPEALDAAIVAALDEARIDLVVLAGYMKKMGKGVLARYRGRIVNTHPALLPKFGGAGMYGMRVHEAVMAAGERETGVTIHWVDEGYDTGAPLAQARLAVAPDDSAESLAKRVQALEKPLLLETLQKIAQGDIKLPAGG